MRLYGALCGRGEMSIESFPGDELGMGGVVAKAAEKNVSIGEQ